MFRKGHHCAFALALLGCAATLPESNPKLDPANPSAEEAPAPTVRNLVEGDRRATIEAPTSARPAIFTCPMHPEVRSTSPGKCPKCGMTLVRDEGEGQP